MRWRKLEGFKLELPRDTLLSVEIVQELKGEVRVLITSSSSLGCFFSTSAWFVLHVHSDGGCVCVVFAG